jgi:hypothetical protein
MYYNLNTLKVEQDCLFPAESQAFLGKGDIEVQLHNNGEVGSLSTFEIILCLLVLLPTSFNHKTIIYVIRFTFTV